MSEVEVQVYLSKIEGENQVYSITFPLGTELHVKAIFHMKPVKIFQSYLEDLFSNICGVDSHCNIQNIALHILLIQQCFLSFPNQFSVFQWHLCCHLQMLLIWTSLKFCCLVKSHTHVFDTNYDKHYSLEADNCSNSLPKWQNFEYNQIQSICRRQM